MQSNLVVTRSNTDGPLLTKRVDVLPQDLVKSWNRKILV